MQLNGVKTITMMWKFLFGGLILMFITATAWANSYPGGVIMTIVTGSLIIIVIRDHWSIIRKWWKRTINRNGRNR